ncbi:acyl-CoA dehydratase activase-related protein, partial [Spirochaetota bacterium]
AARYFFEQDENRHINKLGIIDLSASGYMVISIDRDDNLIDDSLLVNPKCGAGTGVNLTRILEKLDIDKDGVDNLLEDFLGTEGNLERLKVPIRSDRCGVFSSSATISDKNQGIPLDYALAVTMKSEVNKPCSKMARGVEKVYLTGGAFMWQYARDCAEDFLRESGVKEIVYDEDDNINITGMKYLIDHLEGAFRKKSDFVLKKPDTLIELLPFKKSKEKFESKNLYKRMPDPEVEEINAKKFVETPVNIALDIGSTMAKMVVSDANTGDMMFRNSYGNHGDTIETIKHIFRELKVSGIEKLNIQNIGITGSGRYQVQRALSQVYPHLEDRIFVLVENYAHARGSIKYANDHIKELKAKGIENVNENFSLLIDIGGEDTKVSIISLEENELFDNAMNVKCSAGTGSLMDTLKALFGIGEVKEAYSKAYNAEKAYGINATCAVFLMENARKMQAEGYGIDEVLASCCYAIVENMARSLWDQIDFPKNAVALLHGQTMLSHPLPLAVTERIQEYTGSDTYCLVPPLPGHRACMGLIKSIEDMNHPIIDDYCNLNDLVDQKFKKKMFICKGVACGDKNARCARTLLTTDDPDKKIKLKLGGCTAVNELDASKVKGDNKETRGTYKEIWDFIDSKMPKSQDKNRLVIPRSFSVSSHSYFFSKIFEKLGIPVHVDDVKSDDIIEGQPLFQIDTCAPNIGTSGQFLRLAREDHGLILVPQIEFLPTEGLSLGRTCTTNQGGIMVAYQFAKTRYANAKFKVFTVSLDKDDPGYITDQIYGDFNEIMEFYSKDVSKKELLEAVKSALEENNRLTDEITEKVSDIIEESISEGKDISIVIAREYILNPGLYDSHVGKLLKDKGVYAIPSYVFDTYLDEEFGYIYWKNPHDLISKASAIAKKRFHKIIKNKRLSDLVKKIEEDETDSLISLVVVSTFRCGPDTVSNPLIAEVAKNIPSLIIQSDGMIAELAHLENRVNTHLNQLHKKLYDTISQIDNVNFKIEYLNDFKMEELNKETDAIYFPTLSDNRTLTSPLRAGGITVIDNYEDGKYDLEGKAKIGRKYMGDFLCVPLAVVYGDTILAIEDFKKRKEENDPLVKDKERVVVFMPSGDGPCRFGQYPEMAKLELYKMIGREKSSGNANSYPPIKIMENLMSSQEGKKDYYLPVEKWVAYQAFQGIIMHGAFLSVFFKAGSYIKNSQQYEKLVKDFREMKSRVATVIENETDPGKYIVALSKFTEKYLPKLSGLVTYFGYGLYNNNGMRKIFKEFHDKWIYPFESSPDSKGNEQKKLKIHVDGELYLRVAQVEEISKTLIDQLGFGSFDLTYTPVWSVFEVMMEERVRLANGSISVLTESLDTAESGKEKRKIKKQIKEKIKYKKEIRSSINNVRNILAAPIYKAGGVEMPPPLIEAFEETKKIIPTLKPVGELCPYVGETILQLQHGTDLVLNVAPEGCMVSSMGEMLTPSIMLEGRNPGARIQHLFSNEGEVDEEILGLALLKTMGPEKFYFTGSE